MTPRPVFWLATGAVFGLLVAASSHAQSGQDMAFHVEKAEERRAIIDYLKQR